LVSIVRVVVDGSDGGGVVSVMVAAAAMAVEHHCWRWQ